MHFTATDVFDYYKPSRCARRVALKAAGVEPQETDTPFLELLQELGARHEAGQLSSLPSVLDLSGFDQAEREHRTLQAIRDGLPAIYQPRFRAEIDLDGEACELVGEPDFLIHDAGRGGYRIRDSKLARNVLSDRHLGIPLQLQIYGFLYERAAGEPPIRLEIHAGTGEIVPIEYEGGARVLDLLREHRRLRSADPAAYEPVGWSKCGGCGYEDHCWREARAAGDVALLTTVRQDRARELHRLGVTRIAELAAAVDDPDHHDYFWTGQRSPRHKDFVAPLLTAAQSYLENRPIPLEDPPAMPIGPRFAMFDLEGLPPWIDDLDRIYLWGIKVCGERPSGYLAAQAGFGPDGDREGWLAFLRLAAQLFDDYGPNLPFVHWSSYETIKLETYVERYGDPDGVAARVLAKSIDLFRLLKATVVLPLPSYALKVVEGYVGFQRRLTEMNGQESVAKYIEATECADPDARAAILRKILAYNEEDLDATRAVLEWMRTLPRAAAAAG